MKKNRIILSISSDIGFALACDWLKKGFNVSGTYRNYSDKCKELEMMGIEIIKCDLEDSSSIQNSIDNFKNKENWDVLVLAAGTQDPVSTFQNCKFDDWEKSITSNFTGQLRFLHGILFNRNVYKQSIPSVIFFAGGGTNNATVNYSSYTISKIASIKMCELLDAEIKDTSFTILGPGWVKTKIHKSTIDAKENAGENFDKTLEMFERNNFCPMSDVVACCEWIINSKKELVGGRNFSAVFDPWKSDKINRVADNINNYKLRRFGNDLFSDK